MSIEHRASASSGGIELTLGERGGGLSLHVREDITPPAASQPATPAERVLGALSGAPAPLTRRELHDTCRLRNATLVDTLAALQAEGRVRIESGRVQLALV